MEFNNTPPQKWIKKHGGLDLFIKLITKYGQNE